MDESNAEQLLSDALRAALRLTWREMQMFGDGDIGSPAIRDAFIRSLRNALAEHYRLPVFAVFGGKPGKNQSRTADVPTGIAKWHRWEYLYDIAVVEVAETFAAHARDGRDKRQLKYIKKAVWLIESELSNSGREVAIDVSKLRIGNAAHKLFLGRESKKRDPNDWLDFFGRLAIGCDDAFYLGLLPSYASSRVLEVERWKTNSVGIKLYRCRANGTRPEFRSVVSATASPS